MSEARIFNTLIPKPTFLRMLGYCTTIAVHAVNAIYLHTSYKGTLQQDPDIEYFLKYKFRMLTIWTMIAQILYSALGLTSDLLSLFNEGKDTALLKTLKSIRDPLFSSIVFPISWLVVLVFWTFYTYEPTLMLPVSLINTLPRISNHILHSFIIPVTLWEVAFRPRTPPKSHLLNLVMLFGYGIWFVIVLLYTRHDTGRFPYPIFNVTYGTPYFCLILLGCFVLNCGLYKMQWYMTVFLWGNGQKNVRKVK